MGTEIRRSGNTPIGRVTPEELATAAGGNLTTGASEKMDTSSARLREVEWTEYLRHRRSRAGLEAPERVPSDLTGIALSGGGIRSATFALGVLQALAKHRLLQQFDYLSTVSGGGYIGSSLTWLAGKAIPNDKNRRRFGLEPSGPNTASPFPYGTDDPSTALEPDRSRPEGAMLRYLRQHGNYLTPGNGITFTSGIVVLLRGVILNLLVWIPLVATALTFLVAVPVPASLAFLETISPSVDNSNQNAPRLVAFGLLLALAMLLLASCAAAFTVYSLTTFLSHKSSSSSSIWAQLLAGQRYSWRRNFEIWIRWPLWLAAALILLASVPWAARQFHGWVSGPAFSLIGIVSGLVTFAKTMQLPQKRGEQSGWSIPGVWVASVGAAFLLYGVLLLSYAIGRPVGLGLQTGDYAPALALGIALTIALATGILVDLNLITIHRFYRDRLMEAFLPDVSQALANETGPARQADGACLSAMCDPACPVGPYHIINTNLVLTESNERTYRLRGGDNFILSPRHCGSNATGWWPTEDFMGGELTLPTAMAISGAAANPWTASGGVGVTRSLLIATLMALMNLRLGFWARNPNRASCTKAYRPNHFHPGLHEVLGLSLREDASTCLLSDGGHFENLGIYELVRRRLRLIVLCDGAADPNYDFIDLQTALARVWTDFAAQIEFEGGTLGPFIPSIPVEYPVGALISKSAHSVAEITYADLSKGHLVYLTTALIENLRLQLMGYKGANWDFPDQSTGDQFFDETQFEAYRELGFVVAEKALPTIETYLSLERRADQPLAAE